MAFEWSDIGKLVGSAAPIVGTALGGPVGAAVGSIVANLLGVEDNPTSVANAIKADPTIAVKLRELDVEAHRLELEAADKARLAELEAVRMQLADVMGARVRQVDHEKATGKSDVNLYVLAWVIIVGFFALIGMTMFIEIKDATGTVFMLMGTLSAGFGAVIQYFFGSSASSNRKTSELVSMAKTKGE